MKREYNEKHNFYKVTPEDGMVLTQYKEGENIEHYSSSLLLYTPKDSKMEDWREISIEQDDIYRKEQERAVEEKMNNNEKLK